MKTGKSNFFVATIWGVVILTLIFAPDGWAQQYPSRPITITVGFSPGGSTDSVIRPLADAASKILGQPIIIANKPGGATSVSLALIKNEKPDGYGLGYITGSGILAPHWRNLPYDATKDFTPIIEYIDYPLFGIVVRADSPWKTLKDLVAFAKANPGKIKYSTPGGGSVHYLMMESLAKEEGGLKWVHIPAKGGAEATTALLGGHVDVEACSSEWKPYVDSGRLRLLALYGRKSSPIYPGIKNLLALGYKTYITSFGGLIGPKGLPAPIVEKVHNAFKEAMADPVFQKTAKQFDLALSYKNSIEFGKDIQQLSDQWGKFISELGVKKE